MWGSEKCFAYRLVSTLAVLTLTLWDCHANIFFGSKDSTIQIDDNTAMQVNTVSLMNINGGGLFNQGFGVITGQPIKFNRSIYSFFNSISDLQATLFPAANIIQLGNEPNNDATMISNPGGLQGASISGVTGPSILRGQPLFFGTNDLILQNASTVMAVAVQNTLNTNITLNEGLLQLEDDLRLGDDAIILDNGTVVFNSRRFSLGGKESTWNGTILWNSALDLQLNSAINLNGVWAFLGDSGQINGNGNVIDISGGGSIVVMENSVLRLAALHIKGLGATGTIKLSPGAQLILTDAIIEMDHNYHINAGQIYVEGNSTVITKEHLLTFGDGPHGSVGNLTVDRVALTYDTLSTIDKLNIRPPLVDDPTRIHVQIINEGEIRSFRQDTLTYHNYRATGLLFKYAIVAPYREFHIFPDIDNQGNLTYDVTLNGNTNFMGFTRTDQPIFFVSENVHAVTKNITFRDLSTKHIQLEAGANLVFGDETNISFARDEVLNYPWVFEGTTRLYGGGKILVMAPGGSIELRGENSTLLLDGLIIYGLSANNIRCVDDSSKIIMKNVRWVQDGDFTYDHGAIDLLDDVTMVGGITTVSAPGAAIGAQYRFNYNSPQPFTILPNATLSLIRNMVFSYAPANAATNLFQFTDSSATLSLDEATLVAVPMMQLSTGLLFVRDRNFLQGNVVLGASLTIDRPAGATLEQIF